MKKIQRFFLNAMIMTATSLLMNAVGVWFNLYISGKIGAEGMGVFQLIMSVYSFTVTFAASGINLASTRLVAEEAASPNGNVKGAMRRCFGYALALRRARRPSSSFSPRPSSGRPASAASRPSAPSRPWRSRCPSSRCPAR